MAITFMDIARESLRPIKRALGSARLDAVDPRFADLGRIAESRGDDGIGTPIDDFNLAIGRRFDLHI